MKAKWAAGADKKEKKADKRQTPLAPPAVDPDPDDDMVPWGIYEMMDMSFVLGSATS